MLDQPCGPWPLDSTCLPDSWDPEALTPEQEQALAVATEILWRLSAGKYGLCEVTVRPCKQTCFDAVPGMYPISGWVRPYVYAGQWINSGCACSGSCGCGPLCELLLPGPVHSVSEVLVDGVVLAPSSYRVDNARWLVREDTTVDCWPVCQRLDLPSTEVGTFAVTYERGIPVPPAGVRAVTKYAVEVWKACLNLNGCRLPSRVRDIVREGISMTLMDPMDYLKDGLTGLADVDIWLSAVNPGGHRDRTRVYSPGRPGPRRQTFP